MKFWSHVVDLSKETAAGGAPKLSGMTSFDSSKKNDCGVHVGEIHLGVYRVSSIMPIFKRI